MSERERLRAKSRRLPYEMRRLGCKGMNGIPPLERLRESGYNLPEEFACFPPIILDDVSFFWAVRGGNDLLALYISIANREMSKLSSVLFPLNLHILHYSSRRSFVTPGNHFFNILLFSLKNSLYPTIPSILYPSSDTQFRSFTTSLSSKKDSLHSTFN